MKYLILFLIVSGLGYSILAMILVYAISKVRTGYSEKKPFVSVIIAARNESKTIGRCITALMGQDYKPDLFEVIIIDDRSEDETFEVLSHFKSVLNNLKIVKIDRLPENVSPKKHALSKAIDLACGEIILETDADCVVPDTWISGMVRRFEEGVCMVTGIAPYFPGTGALNSFIRHEYLWNATLSSGSIVLGHGTHASARNLGFQRKIFESVGGYGSAKSVISGDDTLFLHRIQKQNKKNVATMPDKSTHVYTDAPENIKSFFRQRARHMSTGKYFDLVHIVTGFFVYGYHILAVVSLLLAVVSLHAFAVFMCSFLWKIMLDSIAALRAKAIFGLDVEWKRFIINEFFLLVYLAVMPVFGLFLPVRWKEN